MVMTMGETYSLCVTHFDGVVDAVATLLVCVGEIPVERLWVVEELLEKKKSLEHKRKAGKWCSRVMMAGSRFKEGSQKSRILALRW